MATDSSKIEQEERDALIARIDEMITSEADTAGSSAIGVDLGYQWDREVRAQLEDTQPRPRLAIEPVKRVELDNARVRVARLVDRVYARTIFRHISWLEQELEATRAERDALRGERLVPAR